MANTRAQNILPTTSLQLAALLFIAIVLPNQCHAQSSGISKGSPDSSRIVQPSTKKPGAKSIRQYLSPSGFAYEEFSQRLKHDTVSADKIVGTYSAFFRYCLKGGCQSVNFSRFEIHPDHSWKLFLPDTVKTGTWSFTVMKEIPWIFRMDLQSSDDRDHDILNLAYRGLIFDGGFRLDASGPIDGEMFDWAFTRIHE